MKTEVLRYSRLSNAQSALDHCLKAHMILLGDDGYFWLVSLVLAERLLKAGYEKA
jgi:hypothetical protein